LKHHLFFTCSNDIIKQAKDKALEKKIKDVSNKLVLIKDEKNNFKLENYKSIYDLFPIFSKKKVYTKRSFVINQVIKLLKEKELLPALCFVLSKRNIEIIANEVTIPLLDDDTKIGSISKECSHIIRKLPNYKEIMELPEYINMIKLLEKGIAIHHSGVLPILREMVEILFSKGFIKLLMATETFAVGINMPTKAVIFTSISKFDGKNNRLFFPHEYTQMAGRAGRRGIDKEGHVILLSNLFPEESTSNIVSVMKGIPEQLQSKFNISYSLILESIQNPNYTIETIIENSMINVDLNRSINDKEIILNKLEKQENELYIQIKNNIDIDVIKEYYELNEELPFTKNSRKKAILKKMSNVKNDNPHIDLLLEKYRIYVKIVDDRKNKEEEKDFYKNYLVNTKKNISNILIETGFLDSYENVTSMGSQAIQIKEMDGMIGSYLINNILLEDLSPIELICLFSCFVDIPTNEENRTQQISDSSELVKILINDSINFINKRVELENNLKVSIDQSLKLNYDLIDYCCEWCDSCDAIRCNDIIKRLTNEKQIFLGDFCKILIKITNISKEFSNICETTNKVKLLSNLSLIPELILKHVMSSQSLYI
jgi:superfamily II RNA helicase